MKLIQKTILTAALLASLAAQAQSGQWQVQIFGQPQPSQPAAPSVFTEAPIYPTHGGQPYPVQAVQPAPAPVAVQPPQSVETIQAQQDARIRWAAQRGYLTEPEYRRFQQMQGNIEYNRRIAYADRQFTPQEQQFIFGQLNVLSADIDAAMLASNYALPYYQQFNAPIPVWTVNNGWLSGRYEIRADAHHSRAYRPVQPPVAPQAVPQGHPNHRPLLRELLDQLGGMR